MPDITIGRLRGGFCVSWREDGKRKRHQLKARTRKEAESEALDVFRRETYRRDESATVADIWETYREELAGRATGETMKWTGKAILPHFGHLFPDQITRDHCRAYDAMRRKDGKSQGSIHTELGHLRSAMKFGEKARIIDRAPYIWRPEKPHNNSMRILNAGEIRRLIDACSDPHVRLAVVLLFGTAARVGAILDLTWDRVDFERGVINLRLDDSATRKGRAALPMNGMTRAALTPAHEAALTDYVVEYQGRRINSIRTGFKAALKRAGIGHMRIHDTRHTAAVTMLHAGVPIEKVSQILGHSTTRVTEQVYARFLPHHMQDGVDVLEFGGIREAK